MSPYSSCAERARPKSPADGARRGGVWGCEIPRVPARSPGRWLVLPSAAVSVLFADGGELALVDAAGVPRALPPGPLLLGPRVTTLTLAGPDGPRCPRLLLAPWTVHTLSGLPMDRLVDRIVPAEEVLGPGVRRLAGDLAAAGDCRDDALRRLGLTLSRWETRGGPPAPPVLRAWSELVRTRGTASIADLARHAGWCHSQLGRRFPKQVGLSPKAAARVLRWREAIRRLAGGEPVAGAALGAGYHDQAHFGHECKAMAGCTPRRFLSTWNSEGFREDAEFLQEQAAVDRAEYSSEGRSGEKERNGGKKSAAPLLLR